jgi:hypothetical protein
MFAHVMGVPVEESALALAPAGAAILSGAAVIARSKLAEIAGRHRLSEADRGERRPGPGHHRTDARPKAAAVDDATHRSHTA